MQIYIKLLHKPTPGIFFNLPRMKILQLIFIRSLYASVPRDYWWSTMEIEKPENTQASTNPVSRDVPKPTNSMRRGGDSPTGSDAGSESMFPRFFVSCVGCCMPGCLDKKKSSDVGEDPRSPIRVITREPIAKVKEHDSGEDEDIRSDSPTDPLPSSRDTRGVQLRRRPGVSPPRTSQATKDVNYITSLLHGSRDTSEDPREHLSMTPPKAMTMNHRSSPVVSPMIVQNSKENVYQTPRNVSSEAHSTNMPTTGFHFCSLQNSSGI